MWQAAKHYTAILSPLSHPYPPLLPPVGWGRESGTRKKKKVKGKTNKFFLIYNTIYIILYNFI